MIREFTLRDLLRAYDLGKNDGSLNDFDGLKDELREEHKKKN